MNIVVVDGATLNPGDLTWSELESLGPCSVYDVTDPGKVPDRCQHADIVITNKVPFDASVMDSLPKLKYIGVSATGYNVVDIEAASEHGIIVTNVPTYGTRSVAQMVFAHLLELCHHVGHHAEPVREGRWCRSVNFCYWDYPLIELAYLVMGIIGFGRIGQAVATLAGAGLDVLSSEPPSPSNPLLKARNCHITPHIAWATRSARSRLMKTTMDNVKAFLESCPDNVVTISD